MALPYTDFNGFRISALGLGCSRLGSIMGATQKEANDLVDKALDFGITFFDTASSYGQGDSERILGRILKQNDEICLVTKVGKQVPLKAKLLRPVKGVVRNIARLSSQAGGVIKQSRPGSLPGCFDTFFLERELINSRRRLSIDCIPMVMLHSPSALVIQRGDAVGVLDAAREKGMLRVVGVAVDSLDAAESTLLDARIKAVQVPFHEGDSAMADWAIKAKNSGKLVIAREILSGIHSLKELNAHDHINANLKRALSSNGVGASLVGTTNLAHLSEILMMARKEFAPYA